MKICTIFAIMIKREVADKLLKLAEKFRVVTVTGPRQSGKTTLVKNVFDNYEYISLENPDIRLRAMEDPNGFVNNIKGKCIIDEVQYVPDLLSYIQTRVDSENIKGSFILTGSQNLMLSENISQSLAGRTAVVKLLPLALNEIKDIAGIAEKEYEELIFNGFYPGIYADNIPPEDFYHAYFETYIQRDVRQLQNIRNLTLFTNFVKLCAGRIGQILDYSSLAADAGISTNTAREWMSILEASYIVFLLQPYYKNFNKRLIKSPKLYFYDTGLASFLLNIQNADQLSWHYLKGGLFENFVIIEMLKRRFNKGKISNLYFWRDNKRNEIDCIADNFKLTAIEIKSGKTFTKEFLKMKRYWLSLNNNGEKDFVLIYGGAESFSFLDTEIYSWKDMPEF